MRYLNDFYCSEVVFLTNHMGLCLTAEMTLRQIVACRDFARKEFLGSFDLKSVFPIDSGRIFMHFRLLQQERIHLEAEPGNPSK